MNFEELQKNVEELIRSGQRPLAQKLLAPLKTQKIPRTRLRAMADLCRRAGSLKLALQLLLPVLRPKVKLSEPATDSEIATYGIVLLGFGATLEALDILESGNGSHPEIVLAKAFTCMNRWDYAGASVHLKHYLTLPGPTEYQQMIAKVNLAASMVALSESDLVQPLLEEIIVVTKQNGWSLLYKNSLEIGAQWAIQISDWTLADQRLKAAESEAKQASRADDFVIQKWKAVADLLRLGPTDETVTQLILIQAQARTKAYWETVRDCDYYKAVACQDDDLFLQLYFGSPFESYRQRIQRGYGRLVTIPESLDFQFSTQSSKRTFDLRIGEEIGGSARLKPGQNLHTAMLALTSDRYRPFGIGSLYSSIFPGEYFNPNSSPGRVSFLLGRLREWFKENQIPLIIEFADDAYRLTSTGPFAIRRSSDLNLSAGFDKQSLPPIQNMVMIEKIKMRWGLQNFICQDVADHLDISERSARTLLKWAVDEKLIERHGTGRATRYKLS